MNRLNVFAVVAAAGAILSAGCVRRPLTDTFGETVRIPVRVDWSRTNIPVDHSDLTGGGYVHRVSLRFYPKDGSEVFERYLEGNIFEGTILVPPGEYSVIVMNESVHDIGYWEDVVTFSDADDYDLFSATVDPMSTGDREDDFPYYDPLPGEHIVVEPYHLASWSLDDFSATLQATPKAEGTAVRNDLTGIVMRRLAYDVFVTARLRNIASTFSIPVAVRGFSDKVYMASGLATQSPVSHLVLLNRRRPDPHTADGEIWRSFLSFGRLPQEPPGSYHVAPTILLTSGELWPAGDPLVFDVTGQVTSGTGPDIEITIPDGESYIELPEVEGGIAVDPWDDENILLN